MSDLVVVLVGMAVAATMLAAVLCAVAARLELELEVGQLAHSVVEEHGARPVRVVRWPVSEAVLDAYTPAEVEAYVRGRVPCGAVRMCERTEQDRRLGLVWLEILPAVLS
jgi:hypothetical protein